MRSGRVTFSGMSVQAITWAPSGAVRIVDQRALPEALVHRDLEGVEAMAEAIRQLQVRGAPLIGIAAAYGIALAAQGEEGGRLTRVREAGRLLAGTRPTALATDFADSTDERQRRRGRGHGI